MAAADAARLPPVAAIADWLGHAGFTRVRAERHLRKIRLVLAEVEHDLRVEARSRYAFLTGEEVEEGVRRMRADAARGDWVDPRPTWVLTAVKSPREPG
jgi:hypothetical protein